MQNFIMRPPAKMLSKVILAALVFMLAGCSMLRLGYTNADHLAYWWLDSYVGFTDEQKPWVRNEIDKFFAWHRHTQLPDYAQVLARTQERLDRPLTSQEVQEEFGVIRKRAERMLEQAIPPLTRLALSLSPEQIASIERKFTKNNEKFRKEYLRNSREERQEARFEKVMKHAEYWFGSFSREQKARIRAASDARPMDYEQWLAERKARQQALLALLKKIQVERPGPEAASAMLREHALALLESTSVTGKRDFVSASREGLAEMTAQIVNLTTPKQKEQAKRQMQKLIEDGYALAGMRPPEQLSMQTE